MLHAEISTQKPGQDGVYECGPCGGDTHHEILSIINSEHYDDSGLIRFITHYLTLRCKGCGEVSFCKIEKNTEHEDYLSNGTPFLVETITRFPDGKNAEDSYVDPKRIAQIAAITGAPYDAAKLVRMLEELNLAYASGSYFSCLMLVRAVLDHVPPVFGKATFADVASQYAGGRSFRDAMLQLQESSRKLADGALHTSIRAREALPTVQQVEFRSAFDSLLGEIVRIELTPP